MPRQLSFDLPAVAALGRDDFFISPANALAVAMMDTTPGWPGGKLALSGPAGAGKTHLAHVWAAQTGAAIRPAAGLTRTIVPGLVQGALAIEDVPQIATDPEAMAALFHLHNLMQAQGLPLLLTGRGTPNHWGLPLPDLQSRIDAAHHVALAPPDDALLAAVMAKLFADRQITPRPDVIPYLLHHMDRSFEEAARLVDRLDRAALSEGCGLSRALAIRVLGDR